MLLRNGKLKGRLDDAIFLPWFTLRRHKVFDLLPKPLWFVIHHEVLGLLRDYDCAIRNLLHLSFIALAGHFLRYSSERDRCRDDEHGCFDLRHTLAEIAAHHLRCRFANGRLIGIGPPI